METFAGILQEQSIVRRPYTFQIGFLSIIQEIPETTRFIKVTDFKGVPMQGVSVTVHNTGGDTTTITNQDGQAEIEPDLATSILIDLKQYSTELKDVSYNTTVDGIVKTVILDTIVPHL